MCRSMNISILSSRLASHWEQNIHASSAGAKQSGSTLSIIST